MTAWGWVIFVVLISWVVALAWATMRLLTVATEYYNVACAMNKKLHHYGHREWEGQFPAPSDAFYLGSEIDRTTTGA
jgi:hypothetical protein